MRISLLEKFFLSRVKIEMELFFNLFGNVIFFILVSSFATTQIFSIFSRFIEIKFSVKHYEHTLNKLLVRFFSV